ncbi:MAG: hypothetical protein KJ706_03140 [Candidatus Omnitrophica bacterium]|nr:hypothetical protein [Candidatus Omnitrophota bacterium]
MNKGNKRKSGFANRLQKEIFLVVLLAALVPAGVVAISLYYLIFGVTAQEIAIPEVIAYNIIPASKRVTAILLFAAPMSILAILLSAYKISHRMVGPFDRVVREIDEYLKGNKQNHIVLRKGDKFRPLVDRVNRLIDKVRKGG